MAEDLVDFLAAGALGGDLLQLFFEFFFGELAAFQPVAGFDHFLDVKLENVAPAEFAPWPVPGGAKKLRAAGRTLAARV